LACTVLSHFQEQQSVQRLTAIVPRRAILELSRLLEPIDREIKLNFCSKTISFSIDDLCFRSKLIEGKYPDYKRVLPKELPYKIRVEREVMRQALLLIQPILSGKEKGILLTFSSEKIEIKAINSENEQVNITVKAEGEAPVLKVGFNLTYLSDFISSVKSDFFYFSLRDDSVGIVMSYDGPGFYVVMPLRL
jgi:DNA polymerase-3 subunit beta